MRLQSGNWPIYLTYMLVIVEQAKLRHHDAEHVLPITLASASSLATHFAGLHLYLPVHVDLPIVEDRLGAFNLVALDSRKESFCVVRNG